MPSRRRVLAVAGAAVAGGCLTSDAPTDEVREPTDGAAATPTPGDGTAEDGAPGDGEDATETPDCYRGFDAYTGAYEPVEQLPRVLRGDAPDLIAAAVEGGTTVETYGGPPVPAGVYVAHEGAYYLTDFEERGAEEVPARKLSVEWERGQSAPDGATVLAYEDLPAADRRALDFVIYGPRHEPRNHPSEGLSASDAPAPYPDGTADSELVERGQAWVAWDDRVYDVRVDGETTLERRTFRYRATEVAADDAAFREYVAREYLVVLDDLSSDAAAVLEEAIADGYREHCTPPSDGYAALRDALPAERELPTGDYWYVEYEGERYRLGFTRWVR